MKRSKSLDLRKPIRKQSKPKFYYLSEKKLVKLKNWLLEKEDKDVIKTEEFVLLVKQQSDEAFENFNIREELKQDFLTYSDLDYLHSSYQGSPDMKQKKQKSHSLKKRFIMKLNAIPKQRKLKNTIEHGSSLKKQKTLVNQDLKRIKRKQVISQLSQSSKASEKQLFSQYVEGEKKTICSIQTQSNKKSIVLGEALRALDSIKGKEVQMKAFVFN